MAATSPPDQYHQDPVIQRLLDWLRAQIANLFTRVGTLETNLGGLRIVRGSVTAAGAIDAGTGFTIAKTGTGLYTITFSPAFSAVPSVVASAGTTAGALFAKQQNGTTPTSSEFKVVTTTSAAVTDSAFHFIAAGPA